MKIQFPESSLSRLPFEAFNASPVGPFSAYLWPPGHALLNVILKQCFTRIPTRRRERIKWLRRKRKIIYQFIAMGRASSFELGKMIVEIDSMTVPSPYSYYQDFVYGAPIKALP